jgi:hypothetical protein
MAVTELSDKELIELWAQLPKRSRVKASLWLRTEAKRLQRPAKKRGPRPASHTKDRRIAGLWITYKAQHRNAKADASFAATLPDELRPKSTRRGGDPYANLMRSIKRGRALDRQRPAVRRLVAELKAGRGLAIGRLAADEVCYAIKAARAPVDIAEIERLTNQQVFWTHQARSALLGGDAWGSFIQPAPKK